MNVLLKTVCTGVDNKTGLFCTGFCTGVGIYKIWIQKKVLRAPFN